MMGALDGLNVIDLSRLLPGPFCTALLADHGANVLMVEAPWFRNDSVLGEVPMVRRNKRHIALDLRKDKGKEIFFQLAGRADVVVDGFRPGVVERLGVGYDAVRSINPRIIYCSLTGYGQTGPLANRAGHDLNYMAATGLLDLIRDRGGNPIKPFFQMADLAGSLYAALGILLAVVARERTGEGQYVDAAMTDGLLSLLAIPISFTASGFRFPGRVDNNSRESFPCYRIYETRDRRHLSVGPLEPHLWESLCRKLGCPEYGPLQFDETARDEISARLEELFRSQDLEYWTSLLSEADDCVAPVLKLEEVPHYEHFHAREMIHITEKGVPAPGIAPKLSGTPGSYRIPAYEFGEHTVEVLTEIGYSSDEIARLREEMTIWHP
ncbi:MAG: CaiB/BaiF CoA-transferase family protein [Thermodesulfobacteriota bacterium]